MPKAGRTRDPDRVDRPIPGPTRSREGAFYQPLGRVEAGELTRLEEVNRVRGQQTSYDPERGPANRHP